MREARQTYSQYLTKPYPVQYPSTTDWQQIGGGQIGTNQIFGQAITEAQLADGSISSAKIGTISADDITTGTLDADRIETNAITASHLAANSVTSSEISTGAVTATKIAANAVTADKISVSTLSAITANMGTITAGNITADTITSGTLSADRISAGSIVKSKIGSGAIDNTKIDTNSIMSLYALQLTDGSGLGPSPYLSIGSSWPCYRGGATLWNATSDSKMKKNIEPLENEKEKIMSLSPITFEYDDKKKFVKNHKKGKVKGFVAEDVQEIFPEWVDTVTTEDGEEVLMLDLSDLQIILTKMVQEHEIEIEELKTQIAELQGN